MSNLNYGFFEAKLKLEKKVNADIEAIDEVYRQQIKAIGLQYKAQVDALTVVFDKKTDNGKFFAQKCQIPEFLAREITPPEGYDYGEDLENILAEAHGVISEVEDIERTRDDLLRQRDAAIHILEVEREAKTAPLVAFLKQLDTHYERKPEVAVQPKPTATQKRFEQPLVSITEAGREAVAPKASKNNGETAVNFTELSKVFPNKREVAMV